MNKVSKATWDYKNGEDAHKEVKRALKEIGVHVYDSPNCAYSDSFGLIFSKEPLSEEAIEEIDDQ